MATTTKPNDAGLYFVDAAGRLVPEGSPDVAQQFDEEGLRASKLGHYASASDEEARVIFARKKADEAEAAEKERQAQLAASVTPSKRERELEARVAALEAALEEKAVKAAPTTKAVKAAPEDK